MQTAVLEVFGDFGFRRASMALLAEAMGVSRQTLYNRFESKEAILDWAVDGLIAELRRRAVACLAEREASTAQALQDAFSQWLGPIVPLLRGTRHGAEMMEFTSDARRRKTADPLEGIRTPLRDFLLERGIRATPSEAEDLSFALIVAGKGLLLTSADVAGLEQGMARVIAGMGLHEPKAARRPRRPRQPSRTRNRRGSA